MTIDTTKTVRETALNTPGAIRAFEDLGIDYCCGGNKPLAQACQDAHLQLTQLLDYLERADATTSQPEKWQESPLAKLAAHIVDTHHTYVKTAIARLRPLLDRVCNVHGVHHPELLRLRIDFQALSQELIAHMMKEEIMLFPYIDHMERAVLRNRPIPTGPLQTVGQPVAQSMEKMVHEHDTAASLLRSMRQISDGYQPPPDACLSYEALYSALAEFERDLHQHLHLENNILFPRAVRMEEDAPCR